ncbi:hypothetical protein CkaCkLH20_03396 [Colletotrichum karsti]|uniref:Peptidase S8/S53 domain-containing protein n=1 Tax=Colletotrichum karsti TaxID=1095194 RepID=A0A9P6LMT6_9PEZI|nr:uncharacterized protein CkaCkLH20_03396 [Colletotrichum karsti]KAF9879163.1 hypothetical protein CkaCkLH20_03396 [Colletotrichum karsti]
MSGASIKFQEPSNRCVDALDYMDEWMGISKADRSRTIPSGAYQAISACVDPKEFRNNMLDKMSVTDFEIRKYIFERILYPLQEALSTAYNIETGTLHKEISQIKAGVTGSFDHQDEKGKEKRDAATAWRTHLNDVYDVFDKCEERLNSCQGLSDADKKATRAKIAVLDTGLQLPDILWENYKERINVKQSEDFVHSKESEPKPYWRVDNDGHGSRVGQIILDFAPAADLHVAKVFDTRADLSNHDLVDEVHERIVKVGSVEALEEVAY